MHALEVLDRGVALGALDGDSLALSAIACMTQIYLHIVARTFSKLPDLIVSWPVIEAEPIRGPLYLRPVNSIVSLLVRSQVA